MLLLDTHAFLWFIGQDDALPAWVVETIKRTENVFVSIAVFWEMAIKNSKSMLELPTSISSIMESCSQLNIRILQINGSHLDKLNTVI